MKYRLNKLLTENLGLKIIALFFAILLWVVVVNYDDPVDTYVFRNIPVTVKNDDVVIANSGKMYQVLDGTDSVSVTVKAKRSILEKIKAHDIVAEADFKEMELVSLVPIKASVKGYENSYVSAIAEPHNLQVLVEAVAKKDFQISVSTIGTLRDGYVLGEMVSNPKSITIGGAESLIKSIDKAVARVDISGMSESSMVNADLILYNTEGNVIDQTLLTNNLGDKGLKVNLEIFGTKDVPISAAASGTPEDGYHYTGISIEPQSVKVYGEQAKLDELNEIIIPDSAIDITGLNDKNAFAIDITEYLPEGINLVDDTANHITITVGIEASGITEIEIPVESINISNLSSNLKMEYQTKDDLKLQFQGEEALLKKLDVKSALFVDLKSYKEVGTYEIPVTVEVPAGVRLVNQPVVTIELTEKE